MAAWADAADRLNRLLRLMLLRSIPSSSIASSVALSSTLVHTSFSAGSLNAPSSSRLYQSTKPSRSQ